MIASPDRTPPPGSSLDGHVPETDPDPLGRTSIRTASEGPAALRITEAETHDGPNGPGSHALRGRAARNAVAPGPPGHVHVHSTHGMSRQSA